VFLDIKYCTFNIPIDVSLTGFSFSLIKFTPDRYLAQSM
jgi:hypothetical protein